MFRISRKITALAALACAAGSLPALAQDNTQFVPIVGYRVGQFASVGSGFYSGMVDYFNMINERDGGVNGVKLTWEECETEYNNARGVECYERLKNKGPTGGTLVQPMSTGTIYWNRGLIGGMVKVEAIRIAQEKYGKGKPVGRSDAVTLQPVQVEDGHQPVIDFDQARACEHLQGAVDALARGAGEIAEFFL